MKSITAILALAAIGLSQTLLIEPVSDTYTLPGGGCFGTDVELLLGNKPSSGHPDERTMIIWSLDEYAGYEVQAAALRLNVFFQCPSGSGTATTVHGAMQSWDETWSAGHIQIQNEAAADYFFLGTGWHEIDVTELVQQWLFGEIENNGLVIKVNGIYPWTKCHSRETEDGPVLEMTLVEQSFDCLSWGGIKKALN